MAPRRAPLRKNSNMDVVKQRVVGRVIPLPIVLGPAKPLVVLRTMSQRLHTTHTGTSYVFWESLASTGLRAGWRSDGRAGERRRAGGRVGKQTGGEPREGGDPVGHRPLSTRTTLRHRCCASTTHGPHPGGNGGNAMTPIAPWLYGTTACLILDRSSCPLPARFWDCRSSL